MAIIAVAGGTSPALGKSIVQACHSSSEHTVIVVSRKSSNIPDWLGKLGVTVYTVDYMSHSDLVKALQGVDTVISTLFSYESGWASAQISLLNAALEAGARRFIPSDWGYGPKMPPRVTSLLQQTKVWASCREKKRLYPDFEWISVHCGGFMNYLGLGSSVEGALNGLADEKSFILDIKNMTANVPLSPEGHVPRITMTELGDIGLYVSALCKLPLGAWRDEHIGIEGDTKRVDDIILMVEKVRGRKISVNYIPHEQIVDDTKLAEKPLEKLWRELEAGIALDEVGMGYFDGEANKRFEEIRPMTYEEYIQKYWSNTRY
jgi:hypothetical protein